MLGGLRRAGFVPTMKLLLLALVALSVGGSTPHRPTRAEPPGWSRTAVLYVAAEGIGGGRGFTGVDGQLPELEALGIDAILLWPPVAMRAEGEEYAIVDETAVDPSWGTAGELHRLVDHAHELGIRVLIDVVLNHTSDQHPRFVSATRQGLGSRYWDDYDRDGDGDVTHYFDWDHLPNLNLEDPEVRRWLIDTGVSWIETFRLDGLRLDAAWALAERRPGFLAELAAEIHAANPDALIIGEASPQVIDAEPGIEVAYDWTDQAGAWAWEAATDANSPALTAALLATALTDQAGWGAHATVIRTINTNDSGPRLVDRIGPEKTRLLAAVQLTLPGIPALFAGDEVGASYEPYADRALAALDDPHDLRPWYAMLINLRSSLPALQGDGLLLLDAPPGVLAFLRGATTREPALVVVNFGDAATIHLFLPGVLEPLEDRLGEAAAVVHGSEVFIEVDARSAAILVSPDPSR